jgi:L-ribulokinase
VPDGVPTSLGSGIFGLVAAGVFPSIEAAQQAMCLPFKIYNPRAAAMTCYDDLYQLYRRIYFSLGQRDSAPVGLGDVLPKLRRIAAGSRVDASPH